MERFKGIHQSGVLSLTEFEEQKMFALESLMIRIQHQV